MAADRSDDIKQLFSHLGLNPGDYQEIRERSRAAPRGESLMPPTVVPAVAPPPTFQIPPTVRVSPAVAAAAPAPPPPPVIAAPGADLSTRWSLLRAAVETPTRVAQIERSPVTAAPPAPASFDMPPIADDAPTRRLFQELSRRPVDEAVDQLAEAARRRWQEPAPAPQPEAAPPTAYPPSQPIHQPPPAPAPPQFTASGELLSTFQRLVAPERVQQQKPARMRFNYQADAQAPRAMQPREENLDDVFSRISDPRLPR